MAWTPDGRIAERHLVAGWPLADLLQYGSRCVEPDAPIALGGAPTPTTQFTSEQSFTDALSPDQTELAVVRGRISSDVVLASTVESTVEKQP